MILEREPATEFEEIGTVQFVATFKRNSYELTKPDGVSESVGETTQKSSQKITDLIRADGKITIEELSEVLGISDRAVKKQLAKMKLEGVLRRVGPDKGGYWEIVS
jgi:ATP-dependent DNA helicase RecG